MQSTFHGLETARRAMMTQQYALHTTGHNIANANTEGYTRQRVNFQQTEAYPSIGKNAPRLPGNLGTGVAAGSIQRVRDAFLDVQYRTENNKVGYWDSRAKALEKMEDILNEPSNEGLNQQIDMLWMGLQDLSVDPEDTGARSVVRQRAVAVAETLNYLANSLSAVRNDYKNEIQVTETEVNALLNQLNNVNEQIRKTEPHGYVTNDLYDQQDQLLDQLSGIVNIQVQREKSGGQPNAAAEGAVTVYLLDEQGNRSMILVNGKSLDPNDPDDYSHAKMSIDLSGDYVNNIAFFKHDADVNDLASVPLGQMGAAEIGNGELKALIEAYGYVLTNGDGEQTVHGLYPDMLAELDTMAKTFADELNAIHSSGYTLGTESDPAVLGGNFFVFDDANPARSIKVSNDILTNLNKIAASSVNPNALTVESRASYEALMNEHPVNFTAVSNFLSEEAEFRDNIARSFPGNGTNAKHLANAKDASLFSNGGTIGSYYQSVIGEMAVSAQEANRMVRTAGTLRDSVDFRRQSVSNVSLDEEMTLMIQYQHAYNAAARNITMVDEMLDRIINGMGVVGR
ncbi:flagellar hook-associated protein FlgK [Halalkalibacter wakoensis JCM 9140]|uniref:Flagellar hook-associated protein 1 n=1 Tax=Halalkalibacter wakoensis JCM 9140 TaxID=1236970 RepID=W4Q368_9BACI|nr:flagellar hook-associated protein FlgK [Halalkalibacter wakoensis]GAE26511.1 flagellar hook-associated protein FlgK [Halalkalibacter wakoensis JCM 9140]